ncbi:DUF2779 domain-containing protein [Candidatus Dehalogenimonas loeffleri]|uniref:DUF2779 domain-containing protein n=1 Tax=Candidatus Dehalogenimonas loeffleri TaxID=3127115 RepID=A0ABZ2J9M1_9CHLR
MNNRSGKLLTKSKFMAGLQCPRYLWFYVNEPQRLPPPDMVTQHTFDQGHEVGELAKQLFPAGIDMAGLGFREMLTKTSACLRERNPIFEAAIQSGQLYARIDILSPSADGTWDIVEVKSGTSVKDENIADVAFQRYVCTQYGLRVNRCRLMYLNREFIKHGEIDPAELFLDTNITEEVAELTGGMADMVEDMLLTMAGTPPDPIISRACNSPYTCPLKNECWQALPENPVTGLYRIGDKIDGLLRRGITAITEIPEDFELNDKQQIQQHCIRAGQPHVNIREIASFLEQLPYPHYYLDFETFATAVPRFDGTRPYQNIPFQFSLHITADEKSPLEHHHFLYQGNADPRPEFVSALHSAMGEGGRVIVYNQSFEQKIMEELVAEFPDYREWVTDVVARMADLIIPFRAFHYYHPAQQGSASLKYVLPALTGIGYDRLNISNGQIASLKYFQAAFGNDTPAEAKTALFEDLLEYCGQDTEGMVRIIEVLRGLVADSNSTNDMA